MGDYWKANDHQWGKGHVHLIRPDGTKTLCGVTLENCPGQRVSGIECDCRGCTRVMTAQKERALREEQWKREQQERAQQERDRRHQEIQERERLRVTRILVNRWEPRRRMSGIAMPFGKYKGMDLADVPEDYLEWLLSQDWLFDDLRANIEEYLGMDI